MQGAEAVNYSNEVTTALRNMMDPRTKVYLVRSRNAIVMLTAAPSQLVLAQKIIHDLDPDRPRP